MVGNDTEKVKAFMSTDVTLKRHIDLMLSLPMKSLDAMAIQRSVSDIGKA